MAAATRSETLTKKASAQILREVSSGASKNYDIFLSHAFADARLINGVRELLTELGFSVYIDWIDDLALNRSEVNKDTAELLRNRMRDCRTLVYAHSLSSRNSKWMPWEVGYFDALKGRVAILPLVRVTQDVFAGTEFLGLYPWIDTDRLADTQRTTAFVNASREHYNSFANWMKTGDLPAH